MAFAKADEIYKAVYEFLGTMEQYRANEQDKEHILHEVLLGESPKELARKQAASNALTTLQMLDILAAIPETRAILKHILEKPLSE